MRRYIKLHAIRNAPDRLEKDGADIAQLLKQNPAALTHDALEILFAKYGCAAYFPRFSPLVK